MDTWGFELSQLISNFTKLSGFVSLLLKGYSWGMSPKLS